MFDFKYIEMRKFKIFFVLNAMFVFYLRIPVLEIYRKMDTNSGLSIQNREKKTNFRFMKKNWKEKKDYL